MRVSPLDAPLDAAVSAATGYALGEAKLEGSVDALAAETSQRFELREVEGEDPLGLAHLLYETGEFLKDNDVRVIRDPVYQRDQGVILTSDRAAELMPLGKSGAIADAFRLTGSQHRQLLDRAQAAQDASLPVVRTVRAVLSESVGESTAAAALLAVGRLLTIGLTGGLVVGVAAGLAADALFDSFAEDAERREAKAQAVAAQLREGDLLVFAESLVRGGRGPVYTRSAKAVIGANDYVDFVLLLRQTFAVRVE